MFFLMHVSTFLQSLSIARMMRINLHPFIWINTIDYLLLWTLVIEHCRPWSLTYEPKDHLDLKTVSNIKDRITVLEEKRKYGEVICIFQRLRIYKGWVYKTFEAWVDGPNPAQSTSDMHHKGCPAVL
eukprot:TRINITY_DN35157_c2_g1_i1.p1 TRINITY_DN35157_c2_g1~~TRINITY_DN35157_c2_g1_i1.p1  ORF type:complete len:127 (-),score=5.71 TRINITY_DN35157_c2_g1_i1:519-899(-)